MAKAHDASVNGIAALYKARSLAERGAVPDDEEARKRYPTLFSMLTCNRVSSDRVADGTGLRISNSCGDWLFALSVPSLGAYLEVMAQTVQGGFDALEAILCSGNPPWKFNLKRPVRVRAVKPPEKGA